MATAGNLSGQYIFAPDGDGGIRFVGDFDGLYNSEEDPWGQSGAGPLGEYYSYARGVLADCLTRLTPRQTILEVGSGLGYVTDYLAKRLPESRVDGMDICAAAVARAHQRFPDLSFHTGDIRNPGVAEAGPYDVVVLNQILWYLLDDLDTALDNAARVATNGGIIVICQAFFKEQRYGRDVIDGFDGLLRYVLNRRFGRLKVLEVHYDDGGHGERFDGLLALRVAA